MADEQNTEQVEQTTTENVENVETKQEQPKETYVNNKGSQIDIDKVVGERLKRRERQIVEELGVEDLQQARSVIDERKKLEEQKQLEKGKSDEEMKKKTQEYNERVTKLEQ